MKILIVDDDAKTKCSGIMEECKRRNIDVVVKTAINTALCEIFHDGGNDIDGIILDMGLPIYLNQPPIITDGGETILKELSTKEYYIPVLVYSETEMHSNYVQVFDKIKDWNETKERKKFFDFLQKLNS